MKSALQTVPRESSRPDSNLAIVAPGNVVIKLPRPSQELKHISDVQTVQWQWDYNFSVSFTEGVFESKPIKAVKQNNGKYLTTPALAVVGSENNVSICTYTSLPDNNAGDPPPPPPPNVVIVDNSQVNPKEK